MNICIVSNFYRPFDRGGSEMVAELSAQAFRELGHTVTVITSCPFSGWRTLWPTLTQEEGMRIYRWYPLNFFWLGYANRHGIVARTLWTAVDSLNIFAYLAVRSILKKEKPDVVISHNIKGLGYLLPRLANRLSPKYIHVLHDVQLVEPSGLLFPGHEFSNNSPLARKSYARFMRWCFKKTKVVVSPSKFLLGFYADWGFFRGAGAQQINNPVVELATHPEKHAVETIIFIGQLEPHKGVVTLLDAWKQLAQPQRRLVIVGDGSLLGDCQNRAANDTSITVTGRLSGAKLEGVWSSADIVVVPSLCLENSPLVISEALRRGCKVVASRVGGIPEFALLSDNVVLFEPDDVSGLVHAIEKIEARPSENVGDKVSPTPKQYAEKLLFLVSTIS